MNTKKLKPGMLLAVKEEKKNKYFIANGTHNFSTKNSDNIRPLSLISTKYTIFKSECGDKWLDNELFLYVGKSNFNINLPMFGEVLASYHQVLWNGEIYEIINHDFFCNLQTV